MASAKAVLFDLDGTLLEPGGSIRRSIDHALTSHGMAPFGPEDILIGMPLRDILALRTPDPAQVESMVRSFRSYFLEHAWESASWYPGFPALLDDLVARHVPLAIVTTKGEAEAQHLLERLGVADRFQAIVGDDDMRPLKPDHAPVLEACRRLGVGPRDAVMVGDTQYDTDAGRAAGCHTIGVRWGHGTSDQGPQSADHLADDAAGLRSILLELLDA